MRLYVIFCVCLLGLCQPGRGIRLSTASTGRGWGTTLGDALFQAGSGLMVENVTRLKPVWTYHTGESRRPYR